MKKIHIYIILIGMLFFISCEKQLEELPIHQSTTLNAVTDYSSAKQLLNGMYNSIVKASLGANLSTRYSGMGGFYKESSGFEMKWTSAEGELAGFWQDSYGAINAANATIDLLSGLAVEEYPSEEIKRSMIAEAKAYRAYNYFHLFYSFCYWWDEDDSPYGLVYRDKTADLSNLQVPRLTVGESFAKIIEDLDEAIEFAPEFKSSSYLSKQMAMVLKAKLLLNRGKGTDYQDALKLVQTVKSSAILESDIKAMYLDHSLNSPEVLWSQNILGANEDPYWIAYDYTYNLTGNWKGFYGNKPDGNIINEVYAREWLLNDPRFPEIYGLVNNPLWWADWKLNTLTKLVIGGLPTDNITIYYFRWAELYLMESELIARTGGSIANALVPVNELRASRTTISLDPLTATTMQEFYDKLFQEYWAELALENGSEYFASLRFMKDGKPWVYSLKTDLPEDLTSFVMPIPDQEISKNKLVVQNGQ